MKLDLQTSLAIVGIVLTLFFGIWSIVTGKVKTGSKFAKLFLVFLVLYAGEIVSSKWLGKPVLTDGTFSTIVISMCVWLMILARSDNE